MNTCENGRSKDLSRLEQILLYKFRNIKLLETALTHRSYFNENKCENVVSYEYLKFLGDSILDFLIRDYVCRICQYVRHLYQNYENKSEKRFIDSLDRIKRKVLSNKFLAENAEKCFLFVDENGVCHSLGYFLRLGVGEKRRYKNSECNSPYIFADVVKALIGAIYLDADFPDGLLASKNFIFDVLKLKHFIVNEDAAAPEFVESDTLKETNNVDDSIKQLRKVLLREEVTVQSDGTVINPAAPDIVHLDSSEFKIVQSAVRAGGSTPITTGDVESAEFTDNSEIASDKSKSKKFDDPKSLLQKIIHICYGKEPRYKQIPIEQRVEVSLSWDDGEAIIGEGRTKREAEIDAANKALERKELHDLLKEKNSKKSLELLRVLTEICVDDSENSSVDDDSRMNSIHSLLENLGAETAAACLPLF